MYSSVDEFYRVHKCTYYVRVWLVEITVLPAEPARTFHWLRRYHLYFLNLFLLCFCAPGPPRATRDLEDVRRTSRRARKSPAITIKTRGIGSSLLRPGSRIVYKGPNLEPGPVCDSRPISNSTRARVPPPESNTHDEHFVLREPPLPDGVRATGDTHVLFTFRYR